MAEEEDDQEEEFEITTPGGNIGAGVELDDFIPFTIETNEPATSFTVIDGVFPESLSLSSDGTISGQFTEMDNYVPEFQPPPDYEIKIDGSTYCSYGSCEAGMYTATFTVEASDGTDSDTATYSIDITNNWSSDRDRMVVDMTEAFGILNFDKEKVYFEIDGEKVTAEEYLQYQKDQGNFGDS